MSTYVHIHQKYCFWCINGYIIDIKCSLALTAKYSTIYLFRNVLLYILHLAHAIVYVICNLMYCFYSISKIKKYMRLTKYLIHLQLHKTSFSSSLDFLEWYIFLTYDPRLPLLTNFLRTKKCSKEKP